jgi:hypothetical protein
MKSIPAAAIGCATLFPQSSSPTASTCVPATLSATGSVISSQALVGGPTPCGSRGGQTAQKSGQDHAPANHSRMLDSTKVSPTSDTFGLPSTTSSRTVTLQSSLVNKLQARQPLNGSPLYDLTWKARAMPSGPPICQLRASARHIPDSDFSGWPTPEARAYRDLTLKVDGIAYAKSRLGHQSEPGEHSVPAWLFDCANPDSVLSTDGLRRPVGQVRAFGNAVVPQVAAEFITAAVAAINTCWGQS